MIVVHCPRCAEAIRVPSTQLPNDAYAQCPLCRETFAASELLDRLPPVVQLMGADGSAMEFFDASPRLIDSQVNHESDQSSEADQGSNLFGDSAGALMSAGGVAAAAVAGGVAAGGASALGLASDTGEAHIEELDEIEELLDDDADDDADDGVLLQHTDDDDSAIESEVNEFLEEISPGTLPDEDIDSSESTLLMDTLDNDAGDFSSVAASEDDEVDVDEEVQQFMGAETVEIESDGLDDGIEAEGEASDLMVEEVSFDDDVESDADDFVTSPPADSPAPMKVRPRPASRKKKASPWKTIAGVALGPMLALPLAGGILLAIGKAPDLGFWPFSGKSDSPSTRVAYNPDETSTLPSTTRSKTFGQSSSLVPENSEVGAFVRDSENQGDVSDLPENTTAGNSLSAPSIPATADSADSPDSGTPSPAGFAFPPSDSASDTADDSSASGMKDPFANPTEDIASPDPVIAIEMPTPIGAPAKDAVPADASTVAPTETVATDPTPTDTAPADTPLMNPSFNDPRKQADNRNSIDSVFGLPNNATASANKVAVDEKIDSAASGNSFGTPDQPAMLRGIPETSDTDDSPFGEGIALAGPAETDSPELAAAARKATEAIIALLTKRADGSATRRDLARTYAAVCQVGAFDSNARSTSVRNLLQEVGQSTLLEDFGGDTVLQWLRYSKRPTAGILLVGTIGGDADSPTIILGGGQSVTATMVDETKLSPAGQRIIGIGVITGENEVQLNAAFPIQ